MRVLNLRLAALTVASGIALGGCAYDAYGPGYGAYSGVSVGVGYGGGYGYPYGGYYSGYYGAPFGWYDDFYYPGTGIYVYDSYRRPRMWNDRERHYWMQRNGGWRQHNNATISPNGTRTVQPNWSGFDHRRNDHRHP